MRRTRWLAGAALAAALLIAGVLGSTILRNIAAGRGAAGRDPLVEEIDRLRAAADSCAAAVSAEEVRFREYDRHVDSLRAAVRSLESAERTVPADEYAGYLELFEEYNESVPEWHERAESLRASWRACREITAAHNVLADSAAGLRADGEPTVPR